MERGLNGRQQGQDQDPRPPPSPTLSLRVGTERRTTPTVATVMSPSRRPTLSPSSSRLPFAPDGRLASVLVAGCPMSERRHNLRA